MSLAFVKQHVVECVGATAGSASGILAIINGKILVINDIHAVVIALFTGMSGGLGALIIKYLWNKVFPVKKNDE